MKVWKPDFRVSFHSILQRILLTRKNTTNAPGDNPALLIFRQSFKISVDVDFEIGQPIFYEAFAEKPAFLRSYFLRNGTDATWIHPQNTSTTLIAKIQSKSPLDTILPKTSLSCKPTDEILNDIPYASNQISRNDRLCNSECKVSRYGRVRKPSSRFTDFVKNDSFGGDVAN